MGKKKQLNKAKTGTTITREGGAGGGWQSISNSSTLLIIAAVLVIGLVHSQHLSLMFENDRYFSALSPLERELSFRTEMGLYYSYFKIITESSSLSDGVNKLINDNITEYPAHINTLKRFNLYPELMLGVMYRGLKTVANRLKLDFEKCSKIERGYGLSMIVTCTGITVPPYFYVYSIFALNSLLPVSIFLLSYYLSNSIFGAVMSVVFFFYNHSEATRVMWTPPLRESFSMPFLFLQFFMLTKILHLQVNSVYNYILFGIASLLFMIPWQFSQFTILTQVLSIVAVYSIGLIPQRKMLQLLFSFVVVLLINAAVQFGNVLLLSSYLMFTLLSSLVIVLCHKVFQLLKYTVLISGVRLALVFGLTLVAKAMCGRLLGIKDDAHIGSILLSKFTSYQDFHTQLYTCAAEFDFVSWAYFGKLSLTLLLPVAIIIMIKIIIQLFKYLFEAATDDTNTQALRLYHILQLSSFALMTVLIMRLKLFLTPHLCVLAGLLASKKLFKLSSKQRLWLLGATVTLSSITGVYNLNQQMGIIGEYSNPELEKLINWINTSLPQDAVFAGSMPLMASIKLTTGRPIVIHPHYEDVGIRERTLLVYTIYSKRPPGTIYSNLRGLGAEYVIMETSLCNAAYRDGCAFRDVYMRYYPEDVNNTVFCSATQHSIPLPFKQLYNTEEYRVLALGNHTH